VVLAGATALLVGKGFSILGCMSWKVGIEFSGVIYAFIW
jgi:hypothetical protein